MCENTEPFLLKTTWGHTYLPGWCGGVVSLFISHLCSPCSLPTWLQWHYKEQEGFKASTQQQVMLTAGRFTQRQLASKNISLLIQNCSSHWLNQWEAWGMWEMFLFFLKIRKKSIWSHVLHALHDHLTNVYIVSLTETVPTNVKTNLQSLQQWN